MVTRVQVHPERGDDRWLEEQANQRSMSKSALAREAVRLFQERDRANTEHMLKLIGLLGHDPDGATRGGEPRQASHGPGIQRNHPDHDRQRERV
jgi:hypothetical protein